VAIVTLRYWAAAKEAAGIAEERISAGTLAEALAAARGKAGLSGPGGPRRRGGLVEQDARLSAVLARSSFLIDGTPLGSRSRDSVVLEDASVIEVLPPFAGG
jgi:molybdopterin synthase sulfur carrier subunit